MSTHSCQFQRRETHYRSVAPFYQKRLRNRSAIYSIICVCSLYIWLQGGVALSHFGCRLNPALGRVYVSQGVHGCNGEGGGGVGLYRRVVSRLAGARVTHFWTHPVSIKEDFSTHLPPPPETHSPYGGYWHVDLGQGLLMSFPKRPHSS